MLFCRECGQCLHIDNATFTSKEFTSGYAIWELDPETEEQLDIIDSATEESSHDCTECPSCESTDIEYGWEGSEEEARDLRDAYNERMEREKKVREEKTKRESELAAIKKSGWDQ